MHDVYTIHTLFVRHSYICTYVHTTEPMGWH